MKINLCHPYSMDRAVDKKLSKTDDLPLCSYTTHRERFFLLSVTLEINREMTVMSEVKGSCLCLNASHESSWQIPCDSLLSAASEAGKKCGISRVARLCCGLLPMMEVDFESRKDIAKFLKSVSKGNFQMCLETQLKTRMTHEISSVHLCAGLYLIVPLAGGHASVTEVTLDNLTYCLETLEEGNNLDYRDITSEDQVLAQNKGL